MEKQGIINEQTPASTSCCSEKMAGVTDPEAIAQAREPHPVTEFAKEAEKSVSKCCGGACKR